MSRMYGKFRIVIASIITIVFLSPLLASAGPPTTAFIGREANNASTYGANNTTWGTYATFNETIMGNVPALLARGINFLLGFLGIIAVILILISGWQWMVAESEDKVKEARKRLVNSVIGLAIIALAWIIGFAIIQTLTTVVVN